MRLSALFLFRETPDRTNGNKKEGMYGCHRSHIPPPIFGIWSLVRILFLFSFPQQVHFQEGTHNLLNQSAEDQVEVSSPHTALGCCYCGLIIFFLSANASRRQSVSSFLQCLAEEAHVPASSIFSCRVTFKSTAANLESLVATMSHFGTCYAGRPPGLVSVNTFYQSETHSSIWPRGYW